MKLQRKANILDQDGFYQELIDSQRGMTDDEASLMNCKLVVLLANHIGDRAVLSEAIRLASQKKR